MSALPAVASIAIDPASGRAEAGWTAVAGVTQYRLRLTQDGEPTEFDLDGTKQTYGFTPQAGAVTALSLAAVAESGGARSTGPFGPAAPFPLAAATLASTDFAGDRLALAWTPVAGATGYRATILRAGAASPELQPEPFGPVAAATIPFTPTAADGSYSAVVQALFGRFDGPPSAAAPVLVAAATLSPPVFDGSTIRGAIAPPAGPAPAAYALRLLRDGVELERQVQAPVAGAVALAPAEAAMAGAAYALEARPVAGIALGPPASVPAVLAAPAVTAIAWNATIDVSAVLGGATGGAARLLADGVAQAPVALGSNGTAKLPIPAEGALALTVQGSAAGAVGPWSLPIALPRAVP
jgi:hypothetical protein